MSKKLLYLLGILLTIIAGTILNWISNCDCGQKSRNVAIVEAEQSIVAIPDVKTADLNAVAPDTAAMAVLQAVREKINAAPLILYFGLNQSDIAIDQEQQQKLKEIVDYVNKVPDAILIVTGHTDNKGSRDHNISLGQERAEFIRAYLVRNGITEAKMTCTSAGPDEPIADNNTSEGRAKNRRTVIRIK